MTTLKVKNYSLVVFQAPMSLTPLFESYEIAKLLGYAQASSLRKQTLTDWEDQMVQGEHFVLIHNAKALRDYEERYARAGNGVLKPMSCSRGRLFFTPQGLLQVLNRSTKPTEDLRAAATQNGYFLLADDFQAGQPCRRCARPLDQDKDCPCTPAPKVLATPAPKPSQGYELSKPAARVPSKEERMFEYEVMTTLLGQLERLKDPQLRGLAITAAETALGRQLEDVRFGEGVKTVFEAVVPKETTLEAVVPKEATPKMVRPTSDPGFKEKSYYSLTWIGDRAGGYSSVIAGKAANVVAKELGYTPDQIRNEQLPINQIKLRPDNTTGKDRVMARFATPFAKKVVAELRSNPAFKPMKSTPGIPTPGYGPLLSRGPFEDDEDATPPRRS